MKKPGSSKALSPKEIAALWRKNDYQVARVDDERQAANQDSWKRWKLDINEMERSRIQQNTPYLYAQMIDRGFLDDQGKPSYLWAYDPRNVTEKP